MAPSEIGLMKRILLITLLGARLALAQPVHDQLRALKDQAVSDLNAGNIDAVVQLADENIDFTAMDARASHGKAELKAYFEKMLKGPDAVVQSFKTTVEADRLTTMYGPDLGVATGTTVSDYRLKDGSNFQIKNRWTATLVRRDGKWLVGSFHSSANVFDNPLLDMSKKLCFLAAAVAGGVGLLGGWLIGRRTRK